MSRYSTQPSAGRSRRLVAEPLEPRVLLDAGVLDPTFGQSGVVEDAVAVAANSFDTVIAAVQDPAGRVIVAGMARSGRGTDSLFDLAAIARYTGYGVLDATFAENGRGTYPLGADSTSVADVAVTGEGKILLAGVTDRGSLLAQLRSDGTVDTQFGEQLSAGSNGTVPLFGTVCAVAVAADGDIVTVSDLSESIFISRFTNDGKRDQSFGAAGIAQVTLSTARPYVQDVLVSADGSIIVAVTENADNLQADLLILRLDSRGTGLVLWSGGSGPGPGGKRCGLLFRGGETQADVQRQDCRGDHAE